MHLHLRWEVDFEKKQGRPPRSGDRSGSHYYTETYKKRAELRAQISNLSANEDPAAGGSRGSGKRGSSSRSRERGGDGGSDAHGAAADPARGGAAAPSSKAAKDAAALAAKAGGEVPAEAGRMSEAAMGQAVELFKKYDGDGDGVLGYSEFFELMKELAQLAGRKHDPMALRALFHQLDADNSRELDFMEFLQLASNGFSAAPVRRAKAAADGRAGGADSHEAVDAETAKERAAMAPEERVLHEWADEFAQDGLGLEDVRRAAALFKKFDHERRGAVSPRSFFQVMQGVGKEGGEEFSQAELQGMLRRADSDADGDVDFYELLQLLARQRRIQGAKQGEGAGQRQERMDRQKAATEAGIARQDSKQARADATAAVDAAAAAKKAARDAELLGDDEDEAIFLAEAAAADQKRRSGNAAGMLNQYRSMLLEEIESENWPALYPHLGEATVEACVSFFDKFDAGRTGRLEEDDFVRGMKAYGKLAKDQSLSKRVLLEHAFTIADKSGDRAITIAEFVSYLGGASANGVGYLSVKPELFAEVAGFVKPEGMEYEIPLERRKKKGHWVEDEEPVIRPGRNPDGSRIVNFMATQPADDFLAGPSGSNNAGKRVPGKKGGGTAAAADAVRSAGPKRGGFMDRMADRANVGIGQMAAWAGEIDIDDGLDAAKAQGRSMGDRAMVSAAGGNAGKPTRQDTIMAKSQARALERRKEATHSKDPLQKLRSAEEERRNEEAIERMALKRQNRSNVGTRGGDAGNFVKKHVDTKALGSGNAGMATRGMDKVLSKAGGGQMNKFLSTLTT